MARWWSLDWRSLIFEVKPTLAVDVGHVEAPVSGLPGGRPRVPHVPPEVVPWLPTTHPPHPSVPTSRGGAPNSRGGTMTSRGGTRASRGGTTASRGGTTASRGGTTASRWGIWKAPSSPNNSRRLHSPPRWLTQPVTEHGRRLCQHVHWNQLVVNNGQLTL